MTPGYLIHFGLKAAPFTKEIPDDELWLPSSKADVVDELVEAVGARESLTLVGEPGVGKTCVLRAVRHRLPQAGFRLTYCHNATLGRRDFYRQLSLALDLETIFGFRGLAISAIAGKRGIVRCVRDGGRARGLKIA